MLMVSLQQVFFALCLKDFLIIDFFKASHRDTFTPWSSLWPQSCSIKVNEVITASLEGTRTAAVEGLERSYFASPAAPCSSPSGQSSQTLPPSRRLHLPAVAATPGQSFFGPLCREPTAPPLQNDTQLKAQISEI